MLDWTVASAVPKEFIYDISQLVNGLKSKAGAELPGAARFAGTNRMRWLSRRAAGA
jgi:hypothetical protein